MYISKKYARQIIDDWKTETDLFHGSYQFDYLVAVLKDKGFSDAEAFTLTAALVIAGAKIRD